MLGLYVEYDRHAVGQTCVMWQAYLFREYVNNVKCMYTSTPDNIVDYTDFIFKQTQRHILSYVYLHTYIWRYMETHAWLVQWYKQTLILVYLHAYTHKQTFMHVCPHIYAYLHGNMHVCLATHMYTFILHTYNSWMSAYIKCMYMHSTYMYVCG